MVWRKKREGGEGRVAKGEHLSPLSQNKLSTLQLVCVLSVCLVCLVCVLSVCLVCVWGVGVCGWGLDYAWVCESVGVGVARASVAWSWWTIVALQ